MYSGAGSGGAEYDAFIARTSGLDSTHLSAYATLIDGLVADGVWPILDVLQIYATQDSTTALLNLKSSSFAATLVGTPTFTADSGFTGGANATTTRINTGFTPSTAGGSYTQNSACIGYWLNTNATNAGVSVSGVRTGPAAYNFHPKYTDNSVYPRINSTSSTTYANSGDARGLYLMSRSGSTTINSYKNGVSLGTADTATSAAVPDFPLIVLGGYASTATYSAPATGQVGSAFIAGGDLDATEQLALYDRLRAYMTAVGVP